MSRPVALLLRLITVAAVLSSAVVVSTAHAGDAPGSPPAPFRVGVAVRSLAPPVPVYAGGFGASPPITREYAPLQVRAIYISNGRQAVAFASVDSQAYFAAYQEGPGFGISSVRATAAARMSASGVHLAADDIIVQGTHSHSAPTLEGIWGPVPPRYLRLVHDRTVAALVAAARTARRADLQWATVEAPWLDNIDTAQYDSFPGWTQDGQLSVLRAVDPTDGATIGSFVNVPAHPDIVCGACLKSLGSDYLGAVRSSLDRLLGGVSVLSPATLGREETPVQATGIEEMRWFAGVVTSLTLAALDHAHWVTDDRIGAAEQMVEIPGTNAALLALVAANHAPDPVKQQMFDSAGEYPIDRQDTPPYLTGSMIGSPVTTLRIGPLAYLSMPGEPFPEVRLNIAKAVQGAQLIVALSKGQDDLGYFYPSWVAPFAAGVYPTDQGTYNVAPQAGDQIMQAQLANLHAVGFTTGPLAVPAPLATRWSAAVRPALQALASPPVGDAHADGSLAVRLQAIYAPADEGGHPLAGPVHWDFGDGGHATSKALSFGGPCGLPNVAGNGVQSCPSTGPAYLTHRFVPGTYDVRASGHDSNGNPVSWTLRVRVYPRLVVQPVASAHHAGTVTLSLRHRGGSGRLLAARWRCRGGRSGRGLTLVVPAPAAAGCAVTATDTAGGTARSSFRRSGGRPPR